MIPNHIVAITVSTNYSDLLSQVLSHNYQYFDHWYIVTAATDQATIDTIQSSPAQDRITVLYHEFAHEFHDPVRNCSQQRWFDKGGAIREAQLRAHSEWPTSWYLIMDTDILIRSARDIITQHLCPDFLYHPQARYDYATAQDYAQGRISADYWCGAEPRPIGFFQLYARTRTRADRLYQASLDTNWCDDEFAALWPECQHRTLPITVDHLGYWAPGMTATHRGRDLGQGWKSQ